MVRQQEGFMAVLPGRIGRRAGLGMIAALAMLVMSATPGLAAGPTGRPPAGETGWAVDLELVLAVDVSGSIDMDEAKLQREGYIKALLDKDVVRAIKSGQHGRIALAYFEWASTLYQNLVVNWMLIDDAESAARFAAKVAAAPIRHEVQTSISMAILYALPMFADNNYVAPRRVVDISGDGPNNAGFPLRWAREQVLSQGVVINGLPILNGRPSWIGVAQMPDLDVYYERCVIGGLGSFQVVAHGIDAFAAAVRRKLILEIAGYQPPPRVTPAAVNDYDCNATEDKYMLQNFNMAPDTQPRFDMIPGQVPR
jgi:hypothetical protein